MCYLTPVPRRVCGSTVSSPFPIDDDTESGNQDDSVLQEPPSVNQNYGCIFPIDWGNFYLTTYGKFTGKYRYQVINKRLLLSKAPISPI